MEPHEVLAEARSIAQAMAIRGAHLGEVSTSVKFRVKAFLYSVPFESWFKAGRKHLSKPGAEVVVDIESGGSTVPVRIGVIRELGGVPGVIDSTAVEICRSIISHLNVANWEQLRELEFFPQFHNWTPEIAEAAILRAAEEIPRLCDELERQESRNTQEKFALGDDDNTLCLAEARQHGGSFESAAAFVRDFLEQRPNCKATQKALEQMLSRNNCKPWKKRNA